PASTWKCCTRRSRVSGGNAREGSSHKRLMTPLVSGIYQSHAAPLADQDFPNLSVFSELSLSAVRLAVSSEGWHNPASLTAFLSMRGLPVTEPYRVPNSSNWLLGIGIAFLVIVVPIVDLRWEYTHGKRLRVVTPGRFYRCGQLSAKGFTDAVARCHIR